MTSILVHNRVPPQVLRGALREAQHFWTGEVHMHLQLAGRSCRGERVRCSRDPDAFCCWHDAADLSSDPFTYWLSPRFRTACHDAHHALHCRMRRGMVLPVLCESNRPTALRDPLKSQNSLKPSMRHGFVFVALPADENLRQHS